MTVAEEDVVSIGLVVIVKPSNKTEAPPPLAVLVAVVETTTVTVFSVIAVTVCALFISEAGTPPIAVAPEIVIESLTAILCSAKSITNDVEPDVVFKGLAKIVSLCVIATVKVSVVLAVIV